MLGASVAAFNASGNKYKINIIKFESIEEMNIQIIAGNIPDLMDVGYTFPFGNYAAKGVFEDLNTYFDSDTEVALVPAVHRALSTGDKLFRVTSGFCLSTLIGISDFVGTENGWTFEEMKQYLADAPEGASAHPFQGSKEALLTFLLYQNMDEYIDWESGTALFNTQDFKELLKFANSVPDTSSNPPNIDAALMGMKLVSHCTVSPFGQFVMIDNDLGGKSVFKGFPGSHKYSGVLYASSPITMTSACSDKDGAWSFIRSVLLTDENFQLFSSVQSRFDTAVETAMSEPNLQFRTDPMTQGQYEKFMRFLDGIGMVGAGDVVLRTIIEEEVPSYFAGDKTLDKVCAIIQNRAQMYVWEQG